MCVGGEGTISKHLSCDPEVIIDKLFVSVKELEQKCEPTEEEDNILQYRV